MRIIDMCISGTAIHNPEIYYVICLELKKLECGRYGFCTVAQFLPFRISSRDIQKSPLDLELLEEWLSLEQHLNR
jgi:hypothetical protein